MPPKKRKAEALPPVLSPAKVVVLDAIQEKSELERGGGKEGEQTAGGGFCEFARARADARSVGAAAASFHRLVSTPCVCRDACTRAEARQLTTTLAFSPQQPSP